MQIGAALVSGLVAGLAVAIPLGAIGALLFTEGLRRGFRRGWPAAAGVAAADASYSILAVVFGVAAAPFVTAAAPWPALVGGVTMIVIAVVGVSKGRSASDHTSRSGPADDATRPARRFIAYLALTLVNPITLLYFIAVSTGIAEIVRTAPSRLAFVTGVGLGSFGWQCVLVAAGAVLSTRIGPRIQRVTLLAGNILIAALGLVILVNGIVADAPAA
ncbi:Threonine/homoserine/homoserine lactone efflux protein [Nakamurella panacisegetis]|uniref:Threonine/homoserine/homoserine lactone efflux protein n=1 Tax=Nakamurella panacisegetis TaxID=1090615 RepID=A0A1H0NCA9_9ACTN|nr:LysE family transporter [Nakamurella panacisegetis]SDO90291.1 Threonine/homoserine/homoserine lactone efflux protein [Nakamurella panacisegetis]